MSEKESKYTYDLVYLYKSYKKYYKKGDMDKARIYNVMAKKLHNVDLEHQYHTHLAKKEERLGPHGIGKYKRIKYG